MAAPQVVEGAQAPLRQLGGIGPERGLQGRPEPSEVGGDQSETSAAEQPVRINARDHVQPVPPGLQQGIRKALHLRGVEEDAATPVDRRQRRGRQRSQVLDVRPLAQPRLQVPGIAFMSRRRPTEDDEALSGQSRGERE
ncbi:hypothetical protein FJ251_10630 [bacterium]|nr:hypothetical protein [bacterium]